MKDSVVISSIRISRELARKMDFVAKKEGTSRAELIRRAVEHYISHFIEEKPKNAKDILEMVERRTGRKPRTVKEPVEIYREEYEREGLI
jgi:predicted DNA-binding protein